MPLAAATTTTETKVGTDAEAVTSEVGFVNVEVEEDEVTNIGYFQEINSQVIDIESSSDIR